MYFILRTCFTCALFAVALAILPPYIKVCKRRDPEINRCVTNSIEQLRDKLAKGIPELGAPAIEPLLLNHVRLLRGPVGARLDVNLTDIQVFGPSTFKIRDLKLDVDKLLFTYKIEFTKLEFRGKYEIDARILLLKLSGAGDVIGTFTGYKCDTIMKANQVVRNNDTYLEFEKMKFTIRIGKAHINLSNLFGGDPILGPASNEILNANNAFLVDELTPVLESSLSDVFTDIANKITEPFTYDELFPTD